MFGSMVGPVCTWSRVRERNAALERSFDLLWQRGDGFRLPEGVPSTLVGLHAAMAERRVGQASLPHVILNGSDVSTGRRILTSSIRTTANLDYFPDSGDFIKLTTHDISLATAVTNSARFPFVSPAGSFWSVTERKGYQIIDGGYFENYGARTAWELARAIEDLNAKDPSLNVVPVVVIVSNDLEAYQPPTVRRGECRPQLGDIRQDGMQITVRCDDHVIQQTCTEASVSTGSMSSGATERSLVPQSLAPFLGLASTRSSHGRDALNIVKRDFCRAPTTSSDVPATRMIHIALPIPETVPDDPQNALQQSAPMNWVLNPHACNYMMNVAPWIAFNRTQAMKLEATMAAIERRTPAKARTDVPSLDCGLGNAKSGQKLPRLIAGIP